MTPRLCLDTSAYRFFKRGHAPVVQLLSSARRVVVPTVVVGELLAGFRLGSRAAKNEAELAEFLAQPVVELLDVDSEVASVYADMVSALSRAGTPLPSNDIWIAAVAAREGVTVVTYDSHFERLRHVAVRLLTH